MSWRPPIAQQRLNRKKSLWGGQRSVRNIYRRKPPRDRKKMVVNVLLIKLGVIGLAGLTVGLILLYYHLLTSPYFCIKDIRNVEVTGTRRLDPALVLKLAKLEPGTNLLVLRPSQVEQMLTGHPWIAKAELTRKWPNRVHLKIHEREPVALVQLEELYYTDRQGHLFRPSAAGDPHDYPVITGLTREHFTPGQGLPITLGHLVELLDLLKEAPPPLNLANISEINVDRERGYTLYANGLKSGVLLGLKDFADKLQKFAKVWPVLHQKGYLAQAGLINLDYPQRVLLSLTEAEDNR